MMDRAVAGYRRAQDLLLPERFVVRRFIARHLATAAPPAGFGIDVGAGTAPFAPAIAEALPGLRQVALDRFPGDRTDLAADAAALPFADGGASLLCFFHVLSHLPDPAPALAEARRVLAPGGCLLVTYPTLAPEGRSRDLWRWTRPGMDRLLARAGFEVLVHDTIGGGVSAALGLLAMAPGRLLIAHRHGWRSGRRAGDAVRVALAFLLALPFHLLGFAALAIDRLAQPPAAFYVGGIVLARRDDAAGPFGGTAADA